MSERQMTGPELAALAFRILGVVILLSGLAQGLFMMLGVVQADWAVWNLVGLLASLVFVGLVALPLIFHSESLVRWLFPRSDKTIALAVTRRDLLVCGLAMVGAWLLATNLPYVARLASHVLWSAEGARRAELDQEFFSRMAFDALGGVFSCVAGWVLFRYAGRISGWWESRARDES